MCVWGGQYVYVYIYVLSMYGQCVHVCRDKVCVVRQCMLYVSVTVGGSMCLFVFYAFISLCEVVCVLCASHICCVRAVHMWYVLGPYHPQGGSISLSTQSSFETFLPLTKEVLTSYLFQLISR